MPNFLTLQKRTILLCGLAAFVAVLLISSLRIRSLGVFFLIFLAFWLYRTCCNFRFVPTPELQHKIAQIKRYITRLRSQRPTMFCAVASVFLLFLAVVGHFISGSTVLLIGIVLTTLLLINDKVKLVKIEPKDVAWTEKLDDNEFDEFLFDLNETNLSILQHASDYGAEIDEHSSDDDDWSNLVLEGTTKLDSTLSSTSSEESLSQGLQFPDHSATVDGTSSGQSMDVGANRKKTQTQAIIEESSQLLPSLVSGLVQWGTNIANASVGDTSNGTKNNMQQQQQHRAVNAVDSSDDGDFGPP